MRLRTIFGFERFMPKAKKTEEKAAKATVEEKAAPKEEVKKSAPKAKAAPKAPAMKVGLDHLPDPDLSPLELGEFITASYQAMLGRDPLDIEMTHHMKTVELHKRPRGDIHTDVRKGGEYQGRHALKGEGTLLGE